MMIMDLVFKVVWSVAVTWGIQVINIETWGCDSVWRQVASAADAFTYGGSDGEVTAAEVTGSPALFNNLRGAPRPMTLVDTTVSLVVAVLHAVTRKCHI